MAALGEDRGTREAAEEDAAYAALHGRDAPWQRAEHRAVAYYYDRDVGNFHYGPGHPMKPQRLALTHELVVAYGLDREMALYRPHAASAAELRMFHAPEYVDFLQRVSAPGSGGPSAEECVRFNIGSDTPVFPGLYDFCRLYAGGSLDGARALAAGTHEVVVNWAGGLHHARAAEPSGFCYVNDIVLAILELLKVHARVLYIDIDVHHGDGVQDAFYATDRVMTLSLHKFGDGFFPGTGDLGELGARRGRLHSLNVPLRNGVDDAGYAHVFQPVVAAIMARYRPGAVVMQCGADSLGCDRLGTFALSIAGHGACVRYVQSFGLPLLVLGGGGYTIRNVSRCWAYETSLCVRRALPNALPPSTPYYAFYAPDHVLHPQTARPGGASAGALLPDGPSAAAPEGNVNTREYLDRVRDYVLERVHRLGGAPSVQMHAVPRPEDYADASDDVFASASGAASGAPRRPSLISDMLR